MLSNFSATVIIGGLSIAICATYEYLLNKVRRAGDQRGHRPGGNNQGGTGAASSIGANVHAYDGWALGSNYRSENRPWPPEFSDN